MKCDICEKTATVFLTQIVDGQMQKVSLCDSCAEEKKVTDPTGFALADLLVGVGEETAAEGGSGEAGQVRSGIICSSCGFSQSDFKRVGRLGCPECYDAFRVELSELLKAMHKGTVHTGKAPSGYVDTKIYREQIAELSEELSSAVGGEDYEKAAQLRDEIRQLEGKLSTSHGAGEKKSAPKLKTELGAEVASSSGSVASKKAGESGKGEGSDKS